MLRPISCILIVMCLTAAARISSAATVINPISQNTAFVVSNSDLINGISPTVTGRPIVPQESTTGTAPTLSNGAFGAANNANLAEVVTIQSPDGNGPTTLTYQLNLTGASAGYDLTQINTYSGWNDTGRDNQTYQVLYSTVADPLTFIEIANINAVGTVQDLGVFISEDDTGILALNAGQIRFIFGTQENGHVGYRELDVVGTASAVAIPEPAGITLWTILGAVGVTWCVYRRRK